MRTSESGLSKTMTVEETGLLEKVGAILESGKHSLFLTPARFVGMNINTFPIGQEDRVAQAIDAIKNGRGVFISGPCGSGKTGLACSLRIEWAKTKLKIGYEWDEQQHRDGRPYVENQLSGSTEFVSVAEFFLQLKDAMDYHQPAGEILSQLDKSNLLILDDVGSEKISEWSRQMFYTLVDRRYRNLSQTIITSNLTLDRLAVLIDDRIASRIADSCAVIYLDKIDHRTKGK
jgi:DNA replication protein DnaC